MRAVLALLAVALLAGCGGSAAADEPESLLGVRWGEDGGALVRFDPRSLEPLPGPRVRLLGAWPWAYAPDGKRVALANCERDETALVRIVEVAALRETASFSLGHGCPAGLAWVGDRLILARYGRPVVVADAHDGRVVARAGVEGALRRSEASPLGLVLLLGPDDAIGPSRVALVRPDGDVSSVVLDRTRSGWETEGEADTEVARQRDPALVLAPDGRRAYVVGAGEPVAEIDLASLTVSYHELSPDVSLTRRLERWLDPAAEAKGPVLGPTRVAAFVGDDLIAVSGRDERGSIDADGVLSQTSEPAGLRLVDTRNWTVRTLDERATGIAVAGHTILAFGAVYRVEGGSQSTEGAGLTAYGAEGQRRFHVLGSDPVWDVQVAWPYAYIGPGEDGVLRVLDLRSGRVVTERRIAWWPQLLPR